MTQRYHGNWRLGSLGELLLLAAVYAVLACIGITLTRDNGVAALWLPNAVLVAVALRTRRNGWAALLAACWATNVAVNVGLGDPLGQSFLFGSAHALETAILFLGVRWLGASDPDTADLRSLLPLVAMSAVAPMVSAILPALALAPPGALFNIRVWEAFATSDSLGLIFATPITLIAIDTWRARRRPTRREYVDWAAGIGGAILLSGIVFGQSRYPLLFLVGPIAVLAAFRAGIAGTAAFIAIFSVFATTATIFHYGPITLVQGGFADRLRVLQFFFAANVAMWLPVAAALAGRAAIARELQENRDFVQPVLDWMKETVFKTDADGRWVFLNPAWQTLTGHTVAESLGQSCRPLLDPAGLVYPRLAAGEVADCLLQQRFRDAAGQARCIDVSVKRLVDQSGAFSGTTGTIRDVSANVAHESALRDSEERFRRLAEAAPVGIFLATTAGTRVYVNAAWRVQTGLHNGEWMDGRWAAAIHPDDRDRVMADWADAVENGEEYRSEFRWLRHDGAVVWAESHARPEFGDSGELRGFIGITMDVSDRKHAERDLAEREEQLALLANNATDAVFRLALDGCCIYASPSAQDLMGLSPAALVGTNLLARFRAEDAAEVNSAFDALASGQYERRVVAFRMERIGDPPRSKWLEANCGLVRDVTTGDPREIIASTRDITERKELEVELLGARTRAEQAVAMKAAFLANMSHEIRTPMNGVIGFTELVLGGELNDEQRAHVQLIAESGRAMMRLLNDILDISKIDSGQMRLVEEPVDIRRTLDSCSKLMEPITRVKGVDVTIAVDPSIPRQLLGDALRLRQILLNLVGNAVKFTETGSVRVHAYRDGTEADPHLCIEVADSGIGITESRLGLIFQQFEQADNSIVRKYGGTGLGLSISNELAKLLGGSISVTSAMGVGSTFTVRFPLRPVTSAPAVEPAHDSCPATRTTALRVLIAEDNDINRALMLAMAARAGLDAEFAVNGEDAITRVKAAAKTDTPFDLVLMDLQMPVIDGFEASRRLRAAGFSAERLPIVALTANAYADDVQACVEAGMQSHLPKPVRVRELVALADRYGRPQKASPGSRAVPTVPEASLQDRYAIRKRETLAAIAALVDGGKCTGAQATEIAAMLHKLAGTAGFFDEERLGETAGEHEHALLAARAAERLAILVGGADVLRQVA